MLHLKHKKSKYGSRQPVTGPAGFPLRVHLREQPLSLCKQQVSGFPHQRGFRESRVLHRLTVSIHPTTDTPVQRSESDTVAREGVGAPGAGTHGDLCLSAARGAASTTRGAEPRGSGRAGDLCWRCGCGQRGGGGVRRSFPEAEPHPTLPETLSAS